MRLYPEQSRFLQRLLWSALDSGQDGPSAHLLADVVVLPLLDWNLDYSEMKMAFPSSVFWSKCPVNRINECTCQEPSRYKSEILKHWNIKMANVNRNKFLPEWERKLALPGIVSVSGFSSLAYWELHSHFCRGARHWLQQGWWCARRCACTSDGFSGETCTWQWRSPADQYHPCTCCKSPQYVAFGLQCRSSPINALKQHQIIIYITGVSLTFCDSVQWKRELLLLQWLLSCEDSC